MAIERARRCSTSLVIGRPMKSTRNVTSPSLGCSCPTKRTTVNVGGGQSGPRARPAGVGDGAGALGKSGGFLKSHTGSLFDSTVLVLGVRPGELNKYVHAKNLYSIIRKSRKTGKPKCPATDEWADKAGWGHAMERCRPRAKQRGRTPKTLR